MFIVETIKGPIILESPRIDYNGITKRFTDIVPRARSTKDLKSFHEVVSPVIDLTIRTNQHLIDERARVDGEYKGLIFYVCLCVENIMPDHLRYSVSMSDDGILEFTKIGPEDFKKAA